MGLPRGFAGLTEQDDPAFDHLLNHGDRPNFHCLAGAAGAVYRAVGQTSDASPVDCAVAVATVASVLNRTAAATAIRAKQPRSSSSGANQGTEGRRSSAGAGQSQNENANTESMMRWPLERKVRKCEDILRSKYGPATRLVPCVDPNNKAMESWLAAAGSANRSRSPAAAQGQEMSNSGEFEMGEISALTRELALIENAVSIGLVDAIERPLLRAHATADFMS